VTTSSGERFTLYPTGWEESAIGLDPGSTWVVDGPGELDD
jgi:hypothetical protein